MYRDLPDNLDGIDIGDTWIPIPVPSENDELTFEECVNRNPVLNSYNFNLYNFCDVILENNLDITLPWMNYLGCLAEIYGEEYVTIDTPNCSVSSSKNEKWMLLLLGIILLNV